ncbi:MAG: patatin-like phospholipase family protein [Phycisphaerales bacterium]|nr:patatin-like phospholipase family protein [Phycisphaerales bacterium]
MLARFDLAVGLVIASAGGLAAQSPGPAPDRPRLGLVLSGGGARGIAHVGVLQVLEELRVPVDVVAGTSMGAIVGGLYAYGLSPDELRAATVRDGAARDWAFLLRDGGERADRPLRRKQEDRAFLTKLRLGLRSGELTTAKGLLAGQNLEVELAWLVREAHALPSFDQLPIPFRCTAVDLADGELVVLDRGNLAAAMRASMSLPVVFAPARIGDREYLDGGLADNVPIDLARAMGAQALIVVDIGTPVGKGVAVDGMFAVSRRMVDIFGQQNVDASLATLGAGDVLVRPDLGDLTSADFERGAEAIRIGADAARALAERLRAFAVDDATYAAWRARQRRAPAPLPQLAEVVTTDLSGATPARVAARVTHAPGATLDEARLRAELQRLFDDDAYERVGFTLRQDAAAPGAAALAVTAEPKAQGSDYVRFALLLETNFADRSDFGLGAQHTLRDLNGLAAELRSAVLVGVVNLASTEWYQPLDADGRWFVAPRAFVSQSNPDLVLAGVTFAESVQELGAAIDVGRALGTWGELRAGYDRAWADIDYRLGGVPLADDTFTDGAFCVRLEVDTVDSPALPSRGTYLLLDGRHAGGASAGDFDYDRTDVLLQHSLPLGRFVVAPLVRWTATWSGELPPVRQPSLGGFLNLSGLRRNTEPAQNRAVAALAARYRLNTTTMLLDLPLWLGGSYEAGATADRRTDVLDRLRQGGSVFLAADTPVGAVLVGAGMASGEGVGLFLLVGRGP